MSTSALPDDRILKPEHPWHWLTTFNNAFEAGAPMIHTAGASKDPRFDENERSHTDTAHNFPLRQRRRSESSISASIRRKFQQVKHSSLKGLSRSSSTIAAKANLFSSRGRHARSCSELQVRRRPQSVSPAFLSLNISEASSQTSDFDSMSNMNDEDVKVPSLLQKGTPMTKVSAKKRKTINIRIDPDEGYLLWESKKSGIIPIENIKEIRSGSETRLYREQFQLSSDYEDLWLTIIYIIDGRYKTLHVVAPSRDVFRMWDTTLREMYAVRQDLMSGLGHVEKRQAVWERRYWKGADKQQDDRLNFEEVVKMCKRLNINFSQENLMHRFNQADSQKCKSLDFNDFRSFVKLLKDRPEITRLYKKLAAKYGTLNLAAFEQFMIQDQKSSLSRLEIRALFNSYAGTTRSASADSDFLGLIPSPPRNNAAQALVKGSGAAATNAPTGLERSAKSIASLHNSQNDLKVSTTPSASANSANLPELNDQEEQLETSDPVMSLESFTSFLLSTDNSVFKDQHTKIWQDMTRPLPEYFISSSHNTYLVGHQLVGVSTVEGYIRALLHSCRSVEVDIYDGEIEPVIYHGKTLTSKVPLRDICQAIAKYAFVASPYPIIISAEVHCSVAQQELIANIMREEFGDSLVSAPIEGRQKIDVLPSPEDLKGKVLLKAKNLYVSDKEGLKIKDLTIDAESSSTDTSTSDNDAQDSIQDVVKDVKQELKHELDKARNVHVVREFREEVRKARHSEPVKELKGELSKVYERVRRKNSVSPSSIQQDPHQRPQYNPSNHLATAAIASSTRAATSTALPMPVADPPKVKMSFALVALLVYTVGVKCRGLNKKETYAPEHVFSLSERTANKVLKQSMFDLVKHNKTHVIRIYPNGTRLNSSNFEPHKYWCAGAQLVAINWQTFDLGYMINHAMFQRNGRAGYVLKPPALRNPSKEVLTKRMKHFLDLEIISAQQLPRRKDSGGREIIDDNLISPFVEVSLHVPDWTRSPFLPDTPAVYLPSASTSSVNQPSSTVRIVSSHTSCVKNNGFNPIWEESMSLPFDCVADMIDLIFVRFTVKDERSTDDEPLAVYCSSLGSLEKGFRHLPLHDAQLSQYLFSTLFVRIDIRDVTHSLQ